MSSNLKLKNALDGLKINEKYKKMNFDESRHKPENILKYLKSSFLNSVEQIIHQVISPVNIQLKKNRDSLPDYKKTDKCSNRKLFLEKTIYSFIQENFIFNKEELLEISQTSQEVEKFLKFKIIYIFKQWIKTRKFVEQMEVDCQIIVNDKEVIDLILIQKYIAIVVNFETFLEMTRVKQNFYNININKFKSYLEKKKLNKKKNFNFKKYFLDSKPSKFEIKRNHKSYSEIDDRKGSLSSQVSKDSYEDSHKVLSTNDAKSEIILNYPCNENLGKLSELSTVNEIHNNQNFEISVINKTSQEIQKYVNLIEKECENQNKTDPTHPVHDECPFTKVTLEDKNCTLFGLIESENSEIDNNF